MRRLGLSLGLAFVALLGGAQASFAQYAAGISPCAAETLSVSGTSSNVQLSLCGPTVLLQNIGSQEMFFNIGAASTTAATTSNYSIPGNTFIVINVPNGQPLGWYLAGITSTSTTTLRVTQGYAQ
jgi:hypothetical protein